MDADTVKLIDLSLICHPPECHLYPNTLCRYPSHSILGWMWSEEASRDFNLVSTSSNLKGRGKGRCWAEGRETETEEQRMLAVMKPGKKRGTQAQHQLQPHKRENLPLDWSRKWRGTESRDTGSVRIGHSCERSARTHTRAVGLIIFGQWEGRIGGEWPIRGREMDWSPIPYCNQTKYHFLNSNLCLTTRNFISFSQKLKTASYTFILNWQYQCNSKKHKRNQGFWNCKQLIDNTVIRTIQS